jgi:cell division protein ZipA
MDEFRLVLIILGALVLGGLFIHGLWTVRKNNRETGHRYHPDTSASATSSEDEDYDDLGVGPVRVVKSRPDSAVRTEPNIVPGYQGGQSERNAASKAKLQPSSSHKVAAGASNISQAQQQAALNFADTEPEKTEPGINFNALPDDESSRNTSVAADNNVQPEQKSAHQPSEVLILYVLLPESREIKGPDLLSALLPLGFKYGDMDIFHRHLDSAGSGEVLFSLANMFNPGTFDLEQIDKISTRGLSLFMTLPGPGEPLQNFNLMHNAAKKLAEEFGGQVLDGQRSVLTVQTVRHYVDKIREFQRQQLIHG